MKILITGLITLAVWSVFSMWLYVDILKPAVKQQAVVEPVVDSRSREADSLMKVYESMPRDLLIYYGFDECEFAGDQETDKSIAEFKKWIDEHPDAVLNVTGHTDFIGTPEYNMELGMRRAKIVGNYIASKGIAADKIVIGSRGKEQPLSENSWERAKNRRTEVSIKK